MHDRKPSEFISPDKERVLINIYNRLYMNEQVPRDELLDFKDVVQGLIDAREDATLRRKAKDNRLKTKHQIQGKLYYHRKMGHVEEVARLEEMRSKYDELYFLYGCKETPEMLGAFQDYLNSLEQGVFMDKEYEEKLKRIIDTYGVRHQLKYLAGELFELQESVLDFENFIRYNKNWDDGTSMYEIYKKHITEELGDNMVMLSQIRLHYDILLKNVEDVMKFKIDRQNKRIDNGEQRFLYLYVIISMVMVVKNVTINMVNTFKIKELGCDFMGFTVEKNALKKDSKHPIQFHHLRIAHRYCLDMPDKGYNMWNGALLINDSHEELHKIEYYERAMFDKITKLMADMNDAKCLDKDTLLEIRAYLDYFENKYEYERSNSGSKIIKQSYKMKKLSLERLDDIFSY